MTREAFAAKLNYWATTVETFLESKGIGEVSDVLSAPASYGVMGSGKRIRPALAMASAETFGLNLAKVLSLSASLELIHAASLMHDDLPCLDNDDLRRGKPSCHKVYGEGFALIAGDYLIARAFSLVAQDKLLSAQERAEVLELISSATEALCDGQALDIKAQCTTTQPLVSSIELREELYQRHMKKTAALITAAVLAPLALVSCNERKEYAVAVKKFGEHLGLLFQIVDDVLDKTASVEKLGKLGNSDERLGVYTYVSLLGVDGARKFAQDEAKKARDALSSLDLDASLLESFVALVLERL